MAKETVIAFPVNLRKNNNRFNKGYGKYYPEAGNKKTLLFFVVFKNNVYLCSVVENICGR